MRKSKVKERNKMPEENQAEDQLSEEDSTDEESSQQSQEETGASAPDEKEAGVADAKIKVADEEYSVDQLSKLIEDGKRYGEFYPVFTRSQQRLAELEKGLEARGSEPTSEQERLLGIVADKVGEKFNPMIEDMRTQMEVKELKYKYGDEVSEETIMQTIDYALQNKIPNLESAYLLMSLPEKMKQAEEKGKEIALKGEKESKRTSPEASGGAVSTGEKGWFKPYSRKEHGKKSLTEVMAEAEEELKRRENIK